MVTKRLAFEGDYQKEFGGRYSRIWKAYRVFNDNIEIGSLYIEPEDYPNRYKVYTHGFEISGDRIGTWYHTEKQALDALIKHCISNN